jgi:prepilin-type N-terminal cleavage/methylation domain-containing protein
MSASRPSGRVQRGVTLVELLVTITVIALAGIALAGTMGYLAGQSGDALNEAQAEQIANANLANTLAKPFASVAGSTFTQGSFQVSIAVANSGALVSVPAAAAKRVDVTVTTTNGRRIIATGYRLSYP